jgi:hypothetical protein
MPVVLPANHPTAFGYALVGDDFQYHLKQT